MAGEGKWLHTICNRAWAAGSHSERTQERDTYVGNGRSAIDTALKEGEKHGQATRL
jgi:hypothetical protein